LGGIGAGIVTAGLAPLIEIAFGYTTDISLLELANLDQPLLRELMVQAPGTYHHSVIVSNMVEATAKAINANPLLAKVSAYYHDIGKMKKPLYFIENQMGGENKHEKLAPSMSSLVLISHIKDGVELAKEHKLGREIIDIIQQHPMDNSGFDEPDGYSSGEYRHTKWRTAWPFESEHGDKEFWGTYARHLWSDQMVATHQLLALLNLQTWAKAYGYKVIIANAFNQHHWNSHLIPSEVGSGVELYLKLNCGALHKKFDWASCDFHRGKDYISFMQKLVELDGKLSKDDWCQFNSVYNPDNMKTHSTYLTNDQGAHPTIKGYRVIADELAEFIRERGYVEES